MIINEEIYGNIATVYHRSSTPPNKFKEILEKNEWQSGIGAGNLYGPGLYTVFTKSSNNSFYGKYLYKLHVKGIKNFFIFLPEVYNRVWGTNKTYDEMIAEQNKRFKCNFKKYTDFVHSYSREHSKCAGIVFRGGHDGNVCIIWEPRNVIPVSYEYDGDSYDINTAKSGKIEMSKEYKSNAFTHGGDIVNYLKNANSLLKKIEEGDFIKCWMSDYDPYIHPDHDEVFFVKKFKKLTSLKNLETASSRSFESIITSTNLEKKYFDSKSFGIYDKNKELIDVVFYDGNYFKHYGNHFDKENIKAIARDIFDINIQEIERRGLNRRLRNRDKELYKAGESHFTANSSTDFVKYTTLPESIKNFAKIKYAEADKNVYDISNKLERGHFVLEFGFYKNGKKATGDDKKELISQLKEKIKPISDIDFEQWIKHGSSKVFNLDLVTEKVSQEIGSNNVAQKVADFFEKEIAKTNFVRELSKIITKRAKSFRNTVPYGAKLKVKNVEYKSARSSDIRMHNNNESKIKARMAREKSEREQQGKYIGKHQYDILNSVETYFPY